MINSNFIIKYTNALYSTPVEYSPRYDEFRDMFSQGQIRSKEWVIRQLSLIDSEMANKRIIIVGAWFGTLGVMLRNKFYSAHITMLDIDPRCEHYIKNISYDDTLLKPITSDMYLYPYMEDIIINTSCEHIPDIKEWVSLLPKGKIVVLQSNNYYNGNGHINCVNSASELTQQSGLSTIVYAGELKMPMYTRYMIIGKT